MDNTSEFFHILTQVLFWGALIYFIFIRPRQKNKKQAAQNAIDFANGEKRAQEFIQQFKLGKITASANGVVLKSKEVPILRVDNVPLQQLRATSQWKSGSRGVSIPIKIGKTTFRTRVGARSGERVSTDTYQPAGLVTVLLTSKRIVMFGGNTKTKIFEYEDGLAYQVYTNGVKFSN